MYCIPTSNNHLEAQYLIGVDYLQGNRISQDYEKAMEWFRKSASGGYAPAQDVIGCMYSYGFGVEQDYAKAFDWCLKAANQGYDQARNNIAYLYREGFGVPQDNTKSFEWYKKSAIEGCANAQMCIAEMYKLGEGINQDYAEAFKWFQKSANQDNHEAQNSIAVMYRDGLGVSQDNKIAMEWFQKSADSGNIQACELLQELSISDIDTNEKETESIDNIVKSEDCNQELSIPLTTFFDSHFCDESKRFPMNVGGVLFFQNMSSEQISKLGKVGHEILQKSDYQIDIGYANFVIDTSMTNNFSAGLFLRLDGYKYTIYIKNLFVDWMKISEVEEAYYCEKSKNLFINDHEFNMFDDNSRFYAEKLADCINAYLEQNDRQDSDREIVSNSEPVTNALDNIDNRLVEIKEKLAALQNDDAA